MTTKPPRNTGVLPVSAMHRPTIPRGTPTLPPLPSLAVPLYVIPDTPAQPPRRGPDVPGEETVSSE